jgi:hypothetical protein
VVDLFAIMRGKVDKLDAESDLKSVIAYNAIRTYLVAIWKPKTQRDP